MPKPVRTHPSIPDHDVLRKIGGGSYGEVWMARGVTGAMRAVKVVWREDFDDERTFEREFEGILKYEPISRNHPGLVNILHVGRSPDGISFYYYVMELGDDVHAGQEINPIEYEARTLCPDGKKNVRLETSVCIDVGVHLAEALEHLHQNGLAHRDVKPSNVIFVNGKAKLADIGLVAARDQRTFVGTEGFVPPEGPGSAQADIYSLGKVLYEIATGKDRLDFPELPDELPTGLERRRWLELNQIICDVCEPRISKRKISTAGELAEALRCLQRGKRRRNPSRSLILTTLVLFGFAAWASWHTFKDSEWMPWYQVPAPRPIVREGLIRIITVPEGAEVYSMDDKWIGSTPTETGTLRALVGSQVEYVIRKHGYKTITVSEAVTPEAATTPMLIFRELQNFSPPVEGEKWQDHMGLTYLPDGDKHVSSNFIPKQIWQEFLKFSKRPQQSVEYLTISENGENSDVVLAQQPDIIAFIDWVRVNGTQQGFFTQDNEITAQVELGFDHPKWSENAKRKNLKPFRLVVGEYKYGAVQLVTEPSGADVYMNGIHSGTTHTTLLIPKVRPGAVELLIILDGYKPLTMNTDVRQGENVALTATLEPSQGVVFGKTWHNSIQMRFEPLGADLMVSALETRVKDYGVFTHSARYERPRVPDFPQGPHHPVVYVSRDDAQAFCKWLTEKERNEELIGQTHYYRLPTDLEWSKMAGLKQEIGDDPSQRDASKSTVYAWTAQWPPPDGFGNYADVTAAENQDTPSSRIISGYTDGFTRTSPTGKFEPNKLGLFDITGNVHEWVENDILLTPDSSLGVLRGGGWNTYREENLILGWRNPVPPTVKTGYYGFRVVLAKAETVEDPPTDNP
jgi:serine/threonine protein kinase/formylglycine-generating enzyme required for sulfatase activity